MTQTKAAKGSRKGERELNERQKAFVREYLIDLNATQAAIRAGYSEKTAAQQAFDLLRKPQIQAMIEAERDKTAKKLEITRERLLEEYAKIAFLDPRKFYKEDGTLKAVPEMEADVAAALQGFEVDEMRLGDGDVVNGITAKIKWHDKRAALDSIARMMGWNQDKLKLQGDVDNPLTMLLQQVQGTGLKPTTEE